MTPTDKGRQKGRQKVDSDDLSTFMAPTLRQRLGVLALVLVLAVGTLIPVEAEASEWVIGVIHNRADAHGVSRWLMREVARCESSFDPGAVGDHGSSHGVFQLNDRRTGLLAHFHSKGYRTAYSVWEAADYFARTLAGEFRREGVTAWRWSCYRIVTTGSY